MSKVYFVNVYCNSVHYPVIDYLVQLASLMDKEDKVVLCFWDKPIYKFQGRKFSLRDTETVVDKTKEIVEQLRSILAYYKIKSQVIFLSDAYSRLVRKEEFQDILNIALGKLTLGYLEDMYKLNKYLAHRPLTISKVIYMVADFLIALGFDKIYPELGIKKIDYYYTGERFKVVNDVITESLSDYDMVYKRPAIKYVSTIPIISYEEGKWISVGMTQSRIKDAILNCEFKKEIEMKDFEVLFKIIQRVIGEEAVTFYKIVKGRKNFLSSSFEDLKKLSKEEKIENLAENFQKYLDYVGENMLDSQLDSETKRINYVKTPEQLKEVLDILNPSKMAILSLCDGTHTVRDIINKSSMKPNSVQSYISRLRAKGLITKDSMPVKKINEILISFD